MNQSLKVPSPVYGEPSKISRVSDGDKKKEMDAWQENLHFAEDFEDPEDPIRLQRNMRLVKDQDKFVEYVCHVESKCSLIARSISAGSRLYSMTMSACPDAKRLKLKSEIEEMHALANAGQQTNTRYVDLTYIVAENEEEEEQRDYSRVAKSTQPSLPHHTFSCIGSSSCLKQKAIKKIFPQTLKQCQNLN